jgi:aspartyl-tRNA(Asn)/glutamyl-tRNA(Gln) amidotransferase subunit A
MNSTIFSFQAESSDKPEQNALRIAIQPNMSCRGWPATAGSHALEKYIALEDATVIRLLKQSGARIVGSTRMSELGFGLAGDSGHQAVCENLADLSLITDSMGEARMAAARSGLFGYKPSYGIVSRMGLIGLIPSMECWGMLAREVSDIRSAMAAICGRDPEDVSMTGDPLPDFSDPLQAEKPSGVIGVAEGYDSHLGKAENAAWQKALSAIEKAGFDIRTIPMPDPALFSLVHHVIGSVEASSSTGKYDGVRYGHRTDTAANWNEMYLKTRGESFGTFVKTFLFQGAYFQFHHYEAFENACRIRGHLLDETLSALGRVNAMASLTVRENRDACLPSDIDDLYEAFSMTLPANLTGLPALSLPGHAIYETTDFGLHLTGKPLHDSALLALARDLGDKQEGGSTS